MKSVVKIFPKLTVLVLVMIVGMFVQDRWQILNRLNFTSFSQKQEAFSSQSRPQSVEKLSMPQFWEAYAYLKRDYLEPEKLENTSKLIDGATGGMVASLGDPYTMYLPPKDNKRSNEDLAGKFYGVGIELGYKDGVLAVVAPLPGSPAERAGVEAGDLILKVKDQARNFEEETTSWSLNKAVENIRGEKGTVVTLTLYRKGENEDRPFDVDITRGEIVVHTVELKFVKLGGKQVAHLKLMRFGGNTDVEWQAAVKQILTKRSELDGVVLDLRNNPGGFFNEAIEVASTFIPSGLVVKQEGRYQDQVFKVTGKAFLKDLPLVVLVNKGSASASEIVAGALRDRLKVKLVGEQTFGKGTVQDLRELINGGGMHITVARWVLPSGDWINEKGIPVDVQVKDDPKTELDEVLVAGVKQL